MKDIKLLLGALLIFAASFAIFIFLEVGWNFNNPIKLTSPLLFALSLTTMIFFSSLRKVFLYGSLILLMAMVFFYLFNQMELANWTGSLGFGILIIVITCFLPT